MDDKKGITDIDGRDNRSMIPYGHQSVDEDDIRAVVGVLKSEYLTQGPAVEAFEKALAAYCGARHAVVFSSGTAALHGTYFAAGLKTGDEFITSPLTFVATANAGLYLGARPVFADVDARGNLDPEAAEAKITKKTTLISVVDYGGHPANLHAFKKLAKRHRLVLVEDACHSLGATLRGKRIGGIADMTVFSFHPVKSITTGEGGAVLTNNKRYADALRMFRTHGITKDAALLKRKPEGAWYYEMQQLGFNYRLTDIQSALGLSQLKKIDRFMALRRSIAARYAKELKDFQKVLQLPTEGKGASSSWHLYPVRLREVFAKKRAEVFAQLRAAGIWCQVHYIPVYLQPYYQKLGYKKGLCPIAEAFYASEISIPIFPGLSKDDQAHVIKTLRTILTA
ncbi:MAG: UDP-4-amino-4,6-dideoxy-N-acetyl-beta-L-altrosamine transaminase [Candidatus Harrisonbacteria bacterium]|nr:UDP-4-amino-4,6-dideoxy-N-acetyl-beta-L-altrosamine transaminase [Candidatus Harrisonbacteria bacterium]